MRVKYIVEYGLSSGEAHFTLLPFLLFSEQHNLLPHAELVLDIFNRSLLIAAAGRMNFNIMATRTGERGHSIRNAETQRAVLDWQRDPLARFARCCLPVLQSRFFLCH